MTQYSAALWLDSDTLAVRSLHPVLELAARIPPPESEKPGPRIGAAYDGEWWQHLLSRHQPPPPGHVNDDINTGVFIIKPGEINTYLDHQFLESYYLRPGGISLLAESDQV